MELIVAEGFEEIPSPWLYDFKKDVWSTYYRLGMQETKNVPWDTQLADELMVWCHEASSLYQFSDRHHYLSLADDKEYDFFYADLMEEHYIPFINDIYKVARDINLSLFLRYKKEFFNKPFMEVW